MGTMPANTEPHRVVACRTPSVPSRSVGQSAERREEPGEENNITGERAV